MKVEEDMMAEENGTENIQDCITPTLSSEKFDRL